MQDILTAIAYLRKLSARDTVNLVGLGNSGVWTVFARALAGPGVTLAADLNQFHPDEDQEYLAKFFVPGIRKAGDFHAAAVLATQGRLLIHNAPGSFPGNWVKQAALLGGTSADVQSRPLTESELVSWLRK